MLRATRNAPRNGTAPAYVGAVRRVRAGLVTAGLLPVLDDLSDRSRTALWVRSWLAVRDLDDLVRLGLPPWTFEAADLVDEHLRAMPGARVLEWGSGAGTWWLAERAEAVTSVEHDVVWAASTAPRLPAHVRLLVREPEPADDRAGRDDLASYVDAADEVPGRLDLVVVGGRARDACLERGLGRLAPGGLLLVADADRHRAALADALRGRTGHEVVWTHGRTPATAYPCWTALVRRAPLTARRRRP